MKRIKLQVFENVCANCGEKFVSLHLPQYIYGPILFATKNTITAFLFPDEDPVWEEVSKLVEKIGDQFGLSKEEKLDVFDEVILVTLDPLLNNQVYIWGKIPCPVCNQLERSSWGPSDPNKFVDVEEKRVTHNRWFDLSNEEKFEKIELVIQNSIKK